MNSSDLENTFGGQSIKWKSHGSQRQPLRGAEHSNISASGGKNAFSSTDTRWRSGRHVTLLLFNCSLFFSLHFCCICTVRSVSSEWNVWLTERLEYAISTCKLPVPTRAETPQPGIPRMRHWTLRATNRQLVYTMPKRINTRSTLSYSSAPSTVRAYFKLAEYELRWSGRCSLDPAKQTSSLTLGSENILQRKEFSSSHRLLSQNWTSGSRAETAVLKAASFAGVVW